MRKLKITPGEWGFGNTSEGQKLILGEGGHGRYVCRIQIHQIPRQCGFMEEEERETNAAFIAEAGTVANETGLMPREMKEQRDLLLTACKEALRVINGRQFPASEQLLIEAIAAVEGKGVR